MTVVPNDENFVRRKVNRKRQHCVYIVQCRYGTYYTGYTNDLAARIALHTKGQGAKYLRGRLPVTLVYTKKYKSSQDALRAERNIKNLTRQEKEILVKGQ